MSGFSPSLLRILGCTAILGLLAACDHDLRAGKPTTTVAQKPAASAPPAAKPTPQPARPAEPPEPIAPAATGPVVGRTAAALAPRLEPPKLRAPLQLGPGAIRVALLLPLTGSASEVGQALLAAAQLALFDFDNPRFTLMPRDTGGTPDGAAEAAGRALSEGAEIILGPVFAESVAAVAPLARSHDVNVVAFSNDRTVAGDGVFLLGLLPEAQVDRVVDFARLQGLNRIAALTPDSPYGQRIVESLERASLRYGFTMAEIARYPTDAGPGDERLAESVKQLADFDRRRAALVAQRRQLRARDDEVSRRALKRLEGLDAHGELGYDAVLVADGGPRLRALAPLLPFYDIDPARIRFLGTALWDDPSIGAEPALLGAWFAAPPPAGTNAFRVRFEATYGRKPLRVASLAYDALALAAALASEPDIAPRRMFDRQALTNVNGFIGYDGIFRFNPDGTAERGLAVIEVNRARFEVVDPAPKSFQGATN